MQRPLLILMTAIAATLALTGCLRRIEIVEIAQDGSVKLTTQIEGDADDVRNGSAMPSAANGWNVDEHQEKEGDKDKLVLLARQSFPPGTILPDSYAAPGSPTYPLDLHFATTLRIEKRAEGTYYHFTRRYAPRRRAQFDYYQEKLIKSGEVRELAEKNPKDLTDDERAKLAERLIRVDLLRTEQFLGAAAEHNPLPQVALLKAQLAIEPLFADSTVKEETINLLRGNPDGDGLAKLENRLKADVRKTVKRVLADAQVDNDEATAYLQAYDDVRTAYQLSEDLGDDYWAVAVRMPGRIIAHNCFDEDSTPADTEKDDEDFVKAMLAGDDFPRGPDRVGWSFDGTALYDREVVLMATSFVPAEPQ
ncbi:MAG: hypothetical protein H6816_08620 [Phycisphaerales bacterium]|nr:hypothetical protein [Phycisphaerales bacterium]